MDGVTLLDQALRAGLTVADEGDRLVVRGPRTADAVARRLLASKAGVLTELRRRGIVAAFPTAPGFAGPIPADWVAIPGSLFPIDPLYRGVLTGEVPATWTREGWLAVTRDRWTRTDDPIVRAMLDAELRAIEATDEKTK